MLIKGLDIKEFRGIRELAKPLELDDFTVLIGRNNVGKSAILEALYMATAPPGASVAPYDTTPYEFIAKLHGGSKALVYGYHGKAIIRLDLGKPIEYTYSDMPVSIDVIELEIDTNSFRVTEPSVDYGDFLRRGIGVEPGGDHNILAVYIPDDSNAYGRILEFSKRDEVLRWAEKEGHNAKAADLVSRVVHDEFTEVLLRGEELCLRKKGPKGPMYIDLRSIGEGVKRFVLAYYAIEYINPRLVLWDDIEVAAHPSLLRVLIEWLSNSGRQVVVSTHSIDTLYNLAAVRPKNCKIIALRKTPNDVVAWRTFTLDEIEDLISSGIDPRKIVDELEL